MSARWPAFSCSALRCASAFTPERRWTKSAATAITSRRSRPPPITMSFRLLSGGLVIDRFFLGIELLELMLVRQLAPKERIGDGHYKKRRERRKHEPADDGAA